MNVSNINIRNETSLESNKISSINTSHYKRENPGQG